ncbi:MAG: HEPN domain-containing protein [Turicibacter sp.]|nr:HEPN domain-containing protein [Turicibacter sp.]
MDITEKYEYWLDIAQYDIDTAQAMLKSGRWLYVVFMCQQAMEKLLKGLYVLYIDDNVPKTHNIRMIAEKLEDLLPEEFQDEHYDLFDDLTVHYLSGRYADYKQKLSESVNKQVATLFFKRTKEVFEWLLTMKQSES